MHAYVKEPNLHSEEPAETHAQKCTHTLETHTQKNSQEITHTQTHSETHTHTQTYTCLYIPKAPLRRQSNLCLARTHARALSNNLSFYYTFVLDLMFFLFFLCTLRTHGLAFETSEAVILLA